jgi:hypothetical protein
MTATRVVVGALGLAGAAYGVLQLLDLGRANLVATGLWLVGGVAIHDGLVAPLAIGVCLVVGRLWRRIPTAVVVGAIVLATVTVTAVPVLGRFGARPDNATLLDRNYLLGWVVVALATAAIVAVALVLRRRTTRTGPRV